MTRSGTLFLVATPIGNMSDITSRSATTLGAVDIVAAEDTRHSKKLFSILGISPPSLVSFHSNNASQRTHLLVKKLKEGADVALITDAGTPGISDPGISLVQAAVENQILVSPIPGPSALILAITASGFPSHRFLFEGFLPRKKGRQKRLESWVKEKRTIVFFESPNRVVKTLSDIKEIMSDRQVCVAREITKVFEEFIRGEISKVIETLELSGKIKGEITVVLAPQGFECNKSKP